ncbi:MAG: mechanosensitive ion channel family protein, partial [Pseudomonadota bacterium]|nr:mechanosensitive ion channel family protein [Pseudomonadota bacterium]
MIFPLSTNSPSPTPTASPLPEAGEASWHWLTDLTHYLDPTHLWGAVGLGIVFIAIGMMLSWIVRRTLKTVIDHDPNERIDRMTVSFIQHLGTFIMWIVLALIFSHVVPSLNKVTTSLLAGVSIVSVVVGFAAQSTLGNLVSGISLVIYKPFRRGDRLQLTT